MKNRSFIFILSLLVLVLVLVLGINAQSEKQKNILLICIDDLRPELASFGAEYIHSPNIDQLAKKGRPFLNHFVNAPSCGPSRYTLLTGTYGPVGNDALFQRAKLITKADNETPLTIPEWFKKHGYTTVSVGKVSHHPGGLGRTDWNNNQVIEIPNAWHRNLMPVGPWQHPRGAMHGLANAMVRSKEKGTMPVYEAAAHENDTYPDDLITKQTLMELETLDSTADKPFFLAVGIIKLHLPFGAPQKYVDLYDKVSFPENPYPNKPQGKTTWHESGEIKQYNFWGKDLTSDSDFALEVRKYYAACVSYADAQVGKILKKLEETGADKNTIVVLWGDHGWNLGEHGIWGKHNLFDVALKSPLIIYTPGLIQPGEKAMGIVETLDIFPTLCDLTRLPKADFSQGSSLIAMLENPIQSGHAAVSYLQNAQSIRVPRYRLIAHDDDYIELYDYESPEKENQNIADEHPEKVAELKLLLRSKIDQVR
jgi:iduronate 2-sulfatase